MSAACDCGIPEHHPTTCDDARKWVATLGRCSKLASLYVSKHCPSTSPWYTRSPVERTDGCMRMICSHCEHQWCWLCRQPWSPTHDDVSGRGWPCNVLPAPGLQSLHRLAAEVVVRSRLDTLGLPEEVAAFVAETAEEMERAACARFLHYVERYQGYDSSETFARSLLERLRVPRCAGRGSSTLKALDSAVAVLATSHNALKWSFVQCYFAAPSPPRWAHEAAQRLLASAVECLNERIVSVVRMHAYSFERLADITYAQEATVYALRYLKHAQNMPAPTVAPVQVRCKVMVEAVHKASVAPPLSVSEQHNPHQGSAVATHEDAAPPATVCPEGALDVRWSSLLEPCEGPARGESHVTEMDVDDAARAAGAGARR